MGYDQVISDVVKVVETVGAAIMVLGGLGAFVVFAFRAVRARTAPGAYQGLRQNLSRCILLGLEVLIVADIVRTIIVDPTIDSVAVLGIIVLIRILLSFSLEVEIDGVWPWRRSQLDPSRDAGAADNLLGSVDVQVRGSDSVVPLWVERPPRPRVTQGRAQRLGCRHFACHASGG